MIIIFFYNCFFFDNILTLYTAKIIVSKMIMCTGLYIKELFSVGMTKIIVSKMIVCTGLYIKELFSV